jgi:multidrug efflux pump subunit AcrB
VAGFVRFFAERHLLVNIMALTMVALGYYFIKDVPREFIPAVASPTVYIRALLPGASASDVETKVTIPIEEALEEVDGIRLFESVISDSASVTTVEMYIDSSPALIEEIQRDMREVVDAITDFPLEMEDEPTFDQFNPAKSPVIEIALSGPPDAVVAAGKQLERELERLDLVSRVTLVGLQDPEVRVLIDPMRAAEHGVALTDVVRAVARRNVSSTGGVLETAAERRRVVLWSRFDDPTEVADTILRSDPGSGTLRISDVARIEATREDTGLLAHTNAEPGISVVVRKRTAADAIEAVAAVKAVIERSTLPAGVAYELVNDRAFFPRNRIELMLNNGVMGAVLVAAVLFVFIRAQAAIWVLAGIPIVFMGALAIFGQTGLTVNVMALTGFVIVLGMVVDDAVVVAERIVAKRAEGLSALDAAVAGATEMARPVSAAALTTVLAFLPLIAIGGLPGKIVWQIPAVVVMVLLLSLIESFCILPAHMTSIHAADAAAKRPFMVALERWYRRLLLWALAHRGVVVFVAASLFFGIMIFIRPLVPFVLFPQDDARVLFVKVTAPIGTPLERTEAITANLQRQIMRLAAVDLNAVTARIGHQEIQGAEKSRGDAEHEALINIIFRDIDRRHTNADWIQILQPQLDVPQGVTLLFQSEYRGPPTDQPVTLHLLADDDSVRRGAALEIADYLRLTPGVIEVEIDERPGTPQVDLNINYEKLALLGLDAQDVAITLQAAFHGIEASEHRRTDDTTELRVMFDPAARGDLQALLEIPVRTAAGDLVRLRDVVNPVEVPALDRIYHRDGLRAATVRASFAPGSGHTALSFAGHLSRNLLPRFADIGGLEILVGGEAEKTLETTRELGQAAVLVVIGIGFVIWILLGSFIEALFVMVVVPFAIAGVFLTFFLHGKALSMMAMMGAIGLAGVVVNASIVMVDSVHRRLQLEVGQRTTHEVVIDAVVERLRPIVVTTLTTLGGVLPMAYGIGGYDTFVAPISLAIGWGLVLSTLVTLILVPVLYTVAKDIRVRLGVIDDVIDGGGEIPEKP